MYFILLWCRIIYSRQLVTPSLLYVYKFLSYPFWTSDLLKYQTGSRRRKVTQDMFTFLFLWCLH